MKRLREPLADAAPLPLFDRVGALPRFTNRRRARRIVDLVQLNPCVATILDRLGQLSVEAWLVSGCLVQTIWNLREGRPAASGIDDYDLIYIDTDTCWAREDAVIRETTALFADLDAKVQIRNQARVPLWYRDKFGFDYPPVEAAYHALLRYPSRSTAIALRRSAHGEWLYYAPFGFEDLFALQVRPNPRLPLEAVYAGKARRWQAEWPQLSVQPWVAEPELSALEQASIAPIARD